MNSLAAMYEQALRCHQAADYGQAETLYRRILAVEPGHVDALHMLGALHYQAGRSELAIAPLREALRLRPDFVGAHQTLGEILRQLGRLEEAVACLELVVALQPGNVAARFSMGRILVNMGRWSAAEASFQEALWLRPDFGDARCLLGNALAGQGRLEEAIACYRQALDLSPGSVWIHNNLGNALRSLGHREEAAACIRRALELQPHDPEAHNNLGAVLVELGQLDEAVRCYRQALELQPHNPMALTNLGLALRQQDKLAEASACLQQAVALQPDLAMAHFSLGIVVGEEGNHDAALRCFERTVALQPDHVHGHCSLGMTWLLLGQFERGWPEYAWRSRCPETAFPPLRQPAWNGSPLDGQTILLLEEQGVGDTLQFIRYAPLVKARGGRVLVWCRPELGRLLATFPAIDGLVRGLPLPEFAVHAPLLGLPRLFDTRLDNIPAAIPYLEPDPARVTHWREVLEKQGCLCIGICWQGNPGHRNDRQRSVALEQFKPLVEVPGVRFVRLQQGAGSDQWPGPFAGLEVTCQSSEPAADWAETAALVAALDLVVSVDTAVAHCAGALGVPVWVALPFSPDWRWLLEREDSPWYPSMRLFRQQQLGQWSDVFERIAAEVRSLAEAPSAE
jgi:tetratricopeptide (TPR) repeat protein